MCKWSIQKYQNFKIQGGQVNNVFLTQACIIPSLWIVSFRLFYLYTVHRILNQKGNGTLLIYVYYVSRLTRFTCKVTFNRVEFTGNTYPVYRVEASNSINIVCQRSNIFPCSERYKRASSVQIRILNTIKIERNQGSVGEFQPSVII